ncbi:type III-A CRISPR-associated RAMP protein Csm4 [Desulfonatronovibrio magnus]|uniref:type III-A CRISPR-associated RAMP protein Csm4 n=1 Tax=Desulfonatronovibrio magnus TaxID=698827 RepID=UPI0005EAF76F|nr:type III-A CRISPR-associated RAMP protein Csm4 [Desulfonatronovibrio magnus]
MLVYKLKFLSALHVDSKGTGSPETAQEFIHSDTISAALCTCWGNLYPDLKADFFSQPEYIISSAFPYIRDVLFFPIPKFRIWGESSLSEIKTYKSVNWISQKVLEMVLSGKIIERSEVFVNKQFAYTKNESQVEDLINCNPWILSERQRVNVDRLGGQSDAGTFFFAQQHFHPECGLFFIAKTSNTKSLESVISFLGDTGIGADRNSGLGHFRVREKIALNIKLPEKYDGSLTLSLYNPGPDDNLIRQTSSCAYNITSRSGWISGSSAGRPPIRVFEEGSYFTGQTSGRVVNLINKNLVNKYNLPLKHDVFRDFRSLSLPCAEPSWIKGAN